jgi:hypothetical protein
MIIVVETVAEKDRGIKTLECTLKMPVCVNKNTSELCCKEILLEINIIYN